MNNSVSLEVRPFGLRLSATSAFEIAKPALSGRRRPDDGVVLMATPNIDHIAWVRRSPAVACAYAFATAVTCDDWPVQLYGRSSGLDVKRATGYEIASELMRGMVGNRQGQQFFFVVGKAESEAALRRWATKRGVGKRVAVFVPPIGFAANERSWRDLVEWIRGHQTTVFVMGMDVPQSEIFVDEWADGPPPGWAFCVGHTIKFELGKVKRALRDMQLAKLERPWRLAQEPKRVTGRCARSSVAILEDQWRLRRRTDAERGVN